MKPILVSGIQPSGSLHIGNYLGALKNFVDLQNSEKYECFFFIADLHALTEFKSKKELEENTRELMISYLAAGLDPKKSTLFLQSQAPAHANLAWILNTITPMGELERMTQYKDKTSRGIPTTAGLFDYPVLMAADILIYKTAVVPVGDDQDQHVELTRTLARSFNNKFGNTFPEPKVVHTKTPRIMDLNMPGAKMSKSSPKGCLFLNDSPETIREKIQRATTDSHVSVEYYENDTQRIGMSNLVKIFAEFIEASPEKIVKKYQGKGYAEFKRDLAE
ncbi:MAG: tryptophan--tRNA ligase, partial [Nanoarchaeota archaeon]|nr:tryptophan--tRNA ligase [Nanoarchaeota archaeon]